ncbi:hypothetical protein [Algibacter sp. 2305UL17-15]|uniref:hypothetical protein n=1 Tax=Algibacter sp. 2305UL17-15 TaxID=3231268 RepID=UPI003459F66C
MKLLALAFFAVALLGAQEKLTKVSQTIKVDKDVTIDLNTSHCNIVFDTWNKGEVQIEAYIESDALTREELEQAMKNWKLEIDGSKDLVMIKTAGNHTPSLWVADHHDHYGEEVKKLLKELKYELADLPEMIMEIDVDIPELPELPEMPEMPELPELPELPKGIKSVAFDYKAYKKDGEKYLEKWSEEFESTYGKDYAKKMEAWGEKFGKEWGEKFGKDMEKWGEKFGEEWGEAYGKKMEAWGERFAAQMERRAEHMEKHAERMEEQHEKRAEMHENEKRAEIHKKRAEAMEKLAEERAKLAEKRAKHIKAKSLFSKKSSGKNKHTHLKKTIIIKMPKKAKIKVNVRHGELEFASLLEDVQADLSYTTFKAEGINGSRTSISAAYAPVYVSHWNLGELNLNHVRDAKLNTVKHVVLNSNSSNVKINNVISSAIVDGNIGDIKILKVDDSFTNLNFIFQNNNAIIVMPKVNYNLKYKGKNSSLSHPNNTDGKNISSMTMSNTESNKTVIVNAKYSKVTLE